MLENDRLKPYFLQIDLENMILAVKNIRMVNLVGITSEFRTVPRFMPARPCPIAWVCVLEHMLRAQQPTRTSIQTKQGTQTPLPDFLSLPSAQNTRQRAKNTRQHKDSAKISLPSVFCRALGEGFAECYIRHSANIFEKYIYKKKTPDRQRCDLLLLSPHFLGTSVAATCSH